VVRKGSPQPSPWGASPSQDWAAVRLALAERQLAGGQPLQGALILREHGENERVLELLPRLGPPPLVRAVIVSIGRERLYQRRAVALFSELREQTADPGRRAELAYLLGELHRRLGEREAARRWFAEVRPGPGVSARLLRWTFEQRALGQGRRSLLPWLLLPLAGLLYGSMRRWRRRSSPG
jgi:hypothetical protein